MGGYVYRAGTPCAARSRRQLLLASAALVLALSLTTEVKAGERVDWLLRDFESQRHFGPLPDGKAQETRPADWPDEPPEMIHDGPDTKNGLIGRSRAGLFAGRRQLVLQAGKDGQKNDVAQNILAGDWTGAGSLILRNRGALLAEADGLVGSAWAFSHYGRRQVSGQANPAIRPGAPGENLAADLTLEQRNKASQQSFGNNWSASASVEAENSGRIEAEAAGLAVEARAQLHDRSYQLLSQGNAASGTAPAASETANSQAHSQGNDGDQFTFGSQAVDAGSLALHNGGEIRTGGDGMRASSRLGLSTGAQQFLLQGNAAPRKEESASPSLTMTAGAEDGGADAAGGRKLQQANVGGQLAAADAWTSAGHLEVFNDGRVDAGGDGISAESEVVREDGSQQRFHQRNVAAQSAAELHQENDATQWATGNNGHRASGTEVQNTGEILAGGRGIHAESRLHIDVEADQRSTQRNRLRPGDRPTASLEDSDLEGAARDRAIRQSNKSMQDFAGGEWIDGARIALTNRGRILAGDSAIVARSQVKLTDAASQILLQVNSARKSAEAIPSSPGAARLEQSTNTYQIYGGSIGERLGALELSNEAELQSGRQGLEASSDIALSADANQELRQQNELVRPPAPPEEGPSPTAAGESTPELLQSNTLMQRAYGVVLSETGTVLARNSGTITAGEHGLSSENRVALSASGKQVASQGNLAGRARPGWEGNASVNATSWAEPSPSESLKLFQENFGRQFTGPTRGQSVGRQTIVNDGDIQAELTGIFANNELESSSLTDQELRQRNEAARPGHLGPVPSDSLEAHGSQSNRGEQRAHGGDWTYAGYLSVENNGRIHSEDNGISLAHVSRVGDSVRQRLAQLNVGPAFITHENEAEQLAEGSRGLQAGGIDIRNRGKIRSGWNGIFASSLTDWSSDTTQFLLQESRSEEGKPPAALANRPGSSPGRHLASQRHLEGDHGFAGAIEISNEGTIEAVGAGIWPWNTVSARTTVEQRYRSDPAAQTAVEQQVMGADWTGASAVSLRNDGTITAGMEGIGSLAILDINMQVAQTTTFASSSTQAVTLKVGERAAAMNMENRGDIVSGWEGISAPSVLRVELDVEQSAASAGTASQLVELEVGEGAGSVTLFNAGEITAGTHGLVGESNTEIRLAARQEGDGADRKVLARFGPDTGIVRLENSREGRIFAEEGWGMIAHSNLHLELPESVELEIASGPRVQVRNDGLIFARSGISTSSHSSNPAFSLGDDIEIAIGEEGVVLALDGPAVDILEGNNNRLINDGLLVSHGAWTITGGSGNESVINRGMLVGNLDLGGGRNSLVNEPGAFLATGSLLDLGNGKLRNRGYLLPGFEDIQHTTVRGDLYLEDGSLYLLDITSAGESDHIQVEGKASVEPGAVLAVERAYGDYPLNQRYAILSSSQEIEGTFTQVDPGLPFIALDVLPEAQGRQLTLHVGRSDTPFDSVGRSRNQRAVARALDTLEPGAPDSLYRQVAWMTEEEAREAYDLLSGEAHATAHALPQDIGRQLRRNLRKRLSGFSGGGGGGRGELQANSLAALALSDADPAATPAANEGTSGPAAWMEAYAGTGQLDGDGNAADTRTESWGGLLGAELLLSENFGMGLALGYQKDRAKIDDRLSRVEVDTYSLSTYGLWRSGDWRLRGGASLAWHDFESERTIRLPSGDRQAKADYDGWSAQAFAEVGHRFQLEALALEPFAGLSFLHSRTESYRETGAGDANLDVRKDRNSTLHSTLGIEVSETFALEEGLRLRPFATLAWEHRLHGSSGDADLAFVTGGSRFSVSGPKRSKDAALLGVGLDIGIGSGVEAFGAYDAYLSRRQQDHSAIAGLRISF